MFGSHKVKIEGELLQQVKRCVEAGGYESVDQFIVRVVEKEVSKLLPPDEGNSPSREALKKRLQGLGYID